MSTVIQSGDKIIYNGAEKTVDQVMGDVVIMTDNQTASIHDVSFLSRPEIKEVGEEAVDEVPNDVPNEEQQTERIALRNAIEDLNPNTIVSVVMNVMARVDTSMRINTTVDWELFKADILRRALELRKIDPRTCNACGQVIHD